MSKKTLGQKIADLREEKGLTQDELADALKITRQRLSLIETDKRAVHSDILKQFAEYFNVSADYLIGLSEIKTHNDEEIQTFFKSCKSALVQIFDQTYLLAQAVDKLGK